MLNVLFGLVPVLRHLIWFTYIDSYIRCINTNSLYIFYYSQHVFLNIFLYSSQCFFYYLFLSFFYFTPPISPRSPCSTIYHLYSPPFYSSLYTLILSIFSLIFLPLFPVCTVLPCLSFHHIFLYLAK